MLIAGLVSAHGLANAQVGALKYGYTAARKYCDAREQGRPHSIALQVALFDGTASSGEFSVRQGSTENVNAQIDFNKSIKRNCPQYLQEFTEEGAKSSTAAMPTGPSCLSSVDVFSGIQTSIISKSCTEGGSIYIKVHR